MTPVTVARADSPLVLGLPHAGTFVPEDVTRTLNDRGRGLSDTDWNIDRLFADLVPATAVRANFHRYVIDANRPPSGESLYPGQATTDLIPLTDFDGESIVAQSPGPEETEDRRTRFHAPYHAALSAEIARVKALHGYAILYDCHSIRSRVPRLFDGTLPDFNIGTDGGKTCAPGLQDLVTDHCAQAEGYTHIVNGRFRGGWTTRHYGTPKTGTHAIQMELAQSTYMDETPPWTWRTDRADRMRAILKPLLEALIRWSPA